MITPSTTGAATYGDSPVMSPPSRTTTISTALPIITQIAACENRRQNPRTGRDTAIIEPIRWQATAAAASATGPPAYPGSIDPPVRSRTRSHTTIARVPPSATSSGARPRWRPIGRLTVVCSCRCVLRHTSRPGTGEPEHNGGGADPGGPAPRTGGDA
jgi:hypothetical protein